MLHADAMAKEAKITASSVSSINKALQQAWEAHDPYFDPDKQRYVPATGNSEDIMLQARLGRMRYRIPFNDCGIYLCGRQNKSTFCTDKKHMAKYKLVPDCQGHPLLTAGAMAGETHKSGSDGKKDVKKVYDKIQTLWEARDPVFDPDKECYIPSDGEETPLTITIGNVTRQIPVKDCGIYANQTFFIDKSQSALINELTNALRAEQRAEGAGKEETNGDDHAALKKSRPTSPRRSPADMSEDERREQKRGGNKR